MTYDGTKITNLKTNWNIGDQVEGTYCDVPFVGVITEGRNAPDYRSWIISVNFTPAIKLWGEPRTRAEVWTR